MSPLARVQLVRAIHVCPPKREILRSEKVSWNDSRGSRRDMLYIETEEGEGNLIVMGWGWSCRHAAGAEAVDMCKRRGCSCMAPARFPDQSSPMDGVERAGAESGRVGGSDVPVFSGPQLTTA